MTIKGYRDSLGVPMEPDYEEVIAEDILGNELVASDEVYDLNGDGYMLASECKGTFKEFMDEYFGQPVELGECEYA